MYIDERINGFQFVFEYEGDEIRSVKIDYLSDGTKIATEDISSVKQVEEIREQLTEKIIINLKGLDALKERKEESEGIFILKVANMFRIDILQEQDDMLDIEVTFITSGKVMTSSVIPKVKKSKLEKLKNILRDNTKYNLTCTQQCLAISYLDMLALLKINKQ